MGLIIKNKINIFIIIDINEKKLDFYFHWYGGTEKIEFKRTISELNPLKYNSCNVEKLNILKSNFKRENIIKSYIPTDITFIDFFSKKFENKKILTSSEELNISSSEIKELFYGLNLFWIQRFSKFSERNFFKDILLSLGSKVFTINNYLFAFKCSDFETNANFENFLNLGYYPKIKTYYLVRVMRDMMK